jgi:FAD/FMN-containing dehydrogenase
VPLGVVSKTGIGGLTLGGGVGWLVRKYGPTVDNVLELETVDAEGKVVTASADRNPDLYWALRGGGGNFGVVTSFLYRAHPVSTVLGGLVVWPRSEAGAVLRRYRDFMAAAPPAELTVYAALITTPDGAPAVAAIPCWCGDPAEGERVLAPLRGFGAPMMDAVAPIPFPQMQRLLDGAFPDGTRNYWKSAFVSDLSDAAIDEIVARSNAMTSPLSSIVVEFYAGPDGRVGTGDSAFAQRRPDYDVGFMAQWIDPAEDAAQREWSRAAVEAMAPYASGGYLLNFLTEEEPETLRGAFGDNLARLTELKRKYDPDNVFSLGQNLQAVAMA